MMDDRKDAELVSVSLPDLIDGRPSTMQSLLRACVGLGFFYLDCRGVDSGSVLEDVQQMYDLSLKFYDLPQEEKSAWLVDRDYDENLVFGTTSNYTDSMVLQEAVAPASDSGFSDSPPNDYTFDSNDQQDATGQTEEQWRINLGGLPKPIGAFGPTGWDTPARIDLLKKSLAESRAILGRPFRQEEVDALSFKFAKSVTIASYAYPTGLVAGALWTYSGRETFKFPFYNPGGKDWFDPNKFSFLRGSQARAAWHGLRFSTYAGFAMFLGIFFWGSVASTTDVAGTVTDPRLKDFREALKTKLQQRQGGMPPPITTQRGPVESTEGRMDSQAARAGTVWERARQNRQAASRPKAAAAQDDDMSPTGGAFMDDLAPGDGDTGLLSDSQMQQNERKQQYESRMADRESRTAPQQQQAQRRQSPQPGPERRDSAVQTGGVWERLRREAATKGADGTQREQQQGSTVGDSFAFSRREEDRQLAQTEAQTDFDARVEKERQGGNFDESRSRKW
ncbi:hypothetical protein BDZ85DRAFT_285593 [Elsinoe ampelina]|uniref:Non-haem dioxygenase N-terminal domain-containing protein n=1 Tax=Elsinoe ampelina TaxID=302913 RepID=A0A6A6G0L5_9PEZI|nr:hypothetical protein BDZ85DRAFT_285593 [Elsinoe ampelina]